MVHKYNKLPKTRIDYSMGKIVKFKQTIEYYIKISDARLAEGDHLGAISAIRSGIEALKPSSKRDSLYVVLGQLYFGINLYELSDYYLFKAFYIKELRACVCFCLGRNMVKLMRYDVADLYFSTCLDYDTTLQFTEFVKEWINHAKFQAPKQHLRPAEERTLALAKSEISRKQFEKALDLLATLPNSTAYSEDALYLEASAYFLMGNYASARESAKLLLKHNPVSIYGYSIMVNICFDEGDYENLEINTSTLLSLTPTSANENYRAALTLARVRKFTESKPYFERLMHTDEYNVKVLFFYSVACYLASEIDNALFYISRAKWIDYDNKILDFYYNYYRARTVLDFPEFVFQIPKNLAKSKLEEVERVLKQGIAASHAINQSHFLLDDIEWTFTLNQPHITSFITEKLAMLKNKKADVLVHNALINNMYNDRHKYEILREHFILGKNSVIDFVADNKYRSLRPSMPSQIANNTAYRQAFIDASCFCECYAPEYNIIEAHKKIFDGVAKAPHLEINLNTLTCAMFSNEPNVLQSACKFFNGSSAKVEELKKLLQLY